MGGAVGRPSALQFLQVIVIRAQSCSNTHLVQHRCKHGRSQAGPRQLVVLFEDLGHCRQCKKGREYRR